MEIKAILDKPYAPKQRNDFIVEQNHRLGYEIRETDEQLQAWGYTQEEIAEQEAEQEAERISGLSMTRGDFFEGMLLAKQVGRPELRALIEKSELISNELRPLYLNRFDEALNFYRKYPILDLLCSELDITTQQLDTFFQTKDWHALAPVVGNGEE